MKLKYFIILFFYYLSYFSQNMPAGFVYLSDIDRTIQQEMRYFTNNNFIGKPIDGYAKNCLIVTLETAKKLKEVQKNLLKDSIGLKIFDGYRPQRAVNEFVQWARVYNDTLMKKQYYPNVPKNKLFKLGYIASKSGHSRGSTVDVTLIHLKTGKELDMGSPYDFFGEESHPFYNKLTILQKTNRILLRNTMLKNGFKPLYSEWWHFTLRNEPFPNTYFNFLIE